MEKGLRCAPDPPASGPSLRLFEAVARATVAVAWQLDVARLVDAILEQTRLLGATVVAVFGADVEARELSLLGQTGMPPDIAQRIGRIPFEAPLISSLAARRCEVQVCEGLDALGPGMSITEELLQRTGTTNVIAFPLVAGGKLVGVLAAARLDPHRFSAEEEAAVLAIMDVFASSLRAARAYEHDRLQVEGLRLAALAMSAPLGLQGVLQSVVDHARTLVGASYAALGIVDARAAEAPFDPWVFSGMDERERSLIGLAPRPVGLLGAVAREGLAVRLKDVAEDERFRGLPPHHPPVKSFVGVPVRRLERVVGNLYVANKEGADEFSEADQRVLEMLAQHAGVAIERAQAHEVLLAEVARHDEALDALKASEERFRRLVDLAPDLICRHRTDPSRAVEYMSPSVQGILGHPPEDYYRDPGLLWRQIHPFDRAILGAALRVTDPFSGPLTLRWLHPNGSIVWVESRFVPVRDEVGAVVGVESISRDVTARKHAESEVERLMEQLRAQRAWLEVIIQSSPVGMILVEDGVGHRISANREAERIFGRPLTAEGGVEQYLAQVRDARGVVLARDGTLVARALRGESARAEERLVRINARDVPVLVSAAPLRDERGRVAGAVLAFKDISALKELERLRDEWTSIVAHDLRQPTSVISIQAGLLMKDVTEPSLRARVEHICCAAEQLTRMIADLLDASRIDARQLPLRLEAVDLAALTRQVVERTSAELAGRVRVEARGEIPPLPVDALRFEEILGNLLSNAVKYGFADTPIDVAMEVGHGEVVVAVTNRGEGIPPEEMPTLFERFRRTDQARRSGVCGVGLGLYIARGLVEAHGGRIWAESVPGGTTTFSFALPARLAEAA